MSTTTPQTAPRSTGPARGSAVRRVRVMSWANAKLMARNRLTLLYATVLPLVPLAFLVSNPGNTEAGATAMSGVLMTALLFPVYYNILSLFVTRRDELVLKRLRTGEARDSEQLMSLALPGGLVALGVMAVAVVAGVALELPMPTNPLLYLVTGVVAIAIFVGLAFATASFTRNAEAAQITSMPVIVVAVLGTLVQLMPDWAAPVVERTPVAAVDALLRISWFGEYDGASLTFSDTWAEAAEPMLVLIAWAVVAFALVGRYLRWEPRA